uniref:Uncharacterized protein n=1 Tax=Takifugu rubripes TaxID=31033 RepID=A0A3B5KNR2_TAKRU
QDQTISKEPARLRGQRVGRLTRLAAYMGTITGCFFCPVNRLTMFRVSIPRQDSSTLLQWEPPHCRIHTLCQRHNVLRNTTSSSRLGTSEACRQDHQQVKGQTHASQKDLCPHLLLFC